MIKVGKMTVEQAILYRKICQFELDLPEAEFPFSSKLAWEYQWSGIYTYRVIQEYKKFIFLAMVANHGVSPSTAVDRVWHLHLLYTDSYWNEFCGKILERSLHHFPSSGGKKEGLKYYSQYVKTLELYEYFFGNPPKDIWRSPKLRSERISFQWVDRHQYWLIPKLNFLTVFQQFYAIARTFLGM